MELILMSLLTAVAVIAGIFIGKSFGEDIGFEMGYHHGLEEGKIDTDEDFPRTDDGRFYSADAAMRNMSIKDE